MGPGTSATLKPIDEIGSSSFLEDCLLVCGLYRTADRRSWFHLLLTDGTEPSKWQGAGHCTGPYKSAFGSMYVQRPVKRPGPGEPMLCGMPQHLMEGPGYVPQPDYYVCDAESQKVLAASSTELVFHMHSWSVVLPQKPPNMHIRRLEPSELPARDPEEEEEDTVVQLLEQQPISSEGPVETVEVWWEVSKEEKWVMYREDWDETSPMWGAVVGCRNYPPWKKRS